MYEDLSLRQKFDNNLSFDLKTILFGYDSQTDMHTSGINTFIVLAKAYIFSCKTRNQNVNYEAAKKYLKYHGQIHKNLCKSRNKEAEWNFLDTWLSAP